MQSILSKLVADFTFGDGTLIRRWHNTKWATLKIAHSTAQRDYVYWKRDVLQELSPSILERDAYVSLTTKGHPEIQAAYPALYKGNIKIISSEYLRKMDAFSIAVHFMDDGTTSKVRRYKIREYDYIYEKPFIKQFRFCLCNFTTEEVARYGALLDVKFGIANRVYNLKSGKGVYPHIVVSSTEAKQKLIDLISPYIISSMNYKLDGPVSRRGIPFEKVLYVDARNDYQAGSSEEDHSIV